MSYEIEETEITPYDETELCQAFNACFSTINHLRKIDNRMKYLDITALQKCKEEIEELFKVVGVTARGGERMPQSA